MAKDMSVGNPAAVLVKFALPMILGNLFQQFYNIVDSIVVGNFVGANALAAVGSSSSIAFLFIAVAAGSSIGASVVISQLFGAREHGRMLSTIYTAIFSIVGVSIVLAVVGLLINKSILTLMNTPPEVFAESEVYLGIYLMGLPFLFLYNALNSTFNAMGDSRTPLFFLILASLLNIVLDLIFVINFNMGVAGVAWATLIAQGVSAALSLAVLLRRIRSMNISEEFRYYDLGCLKTIVKIAIPTIIQQSIVSLGMVSVQSVINSFGSVVMAGCAAAAKIDAIAIAPMINTGNAMASFSAQNIGAGKPERIREGVKAALLLNLGLAVVIGLLLNIFGKQFVGAFMDSSANAEAIDVGVRYLSVISCAYFLFGAMNSFSGVLKGAGDVRFFMLSTVTNFGVRVASCFILSSIVGVPIVWWSSIIGWFLGASLNMGRFFQGGWKSKKLI